MAKKNRKGKSKQERKLIAQREATRRDFETNISDSVDLVFSMTQLKHLVEREEYKEHSTPEELKKSVLMLGLAAKAILPLAKLVRANQPLLTNNKHRKMDVADLNEINNNLIVAMAGYNEAVLNTGVLADLSALTQDICSRIPESNPEAQEEQA